MTSDRKNHTATILADGRVLITGGTSGVSATPVSSAEIFDPQTGSFTATASMTTGRVYHTATLLANGKVLITGGYNGTAYVATAELFDPAAGTNGNFNSTGSMSTSRANHTATLLADGTVLVAGGQSGSAKSTILDSAQIYDPATGLFAATNGSLSVGRRYHSATLLSDGRVLIAGGGTTDTTTNSAAIYIPATGTFTALSATMASPRNSHAAVLLNDGRVLLTGGYNVSTILASAEIFDPAGAGTFSATASPMASGRVNHTATRLLNGKVLIAGGYISFSTTSASGELFNTAAGGSFVAAGTMTSARAYHSAVTLNNGKVLISGGTAASYALFSTELYDPAAIKVSPPEHTFPDAYVSESSTPQSFTITNSGSVDLTLNSIGISGSDGSMFSLTTDACGPLPHTLTANGGNCSVSVNFFPTSSGAKTASLAISSTDPEMPVLSAGLSGTGVGIIQIQPTLTILFDGTGAGSTTSAQAGLTCLSGSSAPCQAQVDAGTVISVYPTADKDSIFAGWSGDCSGSGDCTITLNNDSYVTATFSYIEPARINGTYFPSLQEAYAGAFAGVGNVILARAFSFTGPLVCDKDISVSLKGGYDLTYSTNTDYSVVNGGLIISNGSVAVEGIVFQ